MNHRTGWLALASVTLSLAPGSSAQSTNERERVRTLIW